MIDTYTKIILTVIAAAMVAQVVVDEIKTSAISHYVHESCGSTGNPCYFRYSVLNQLWRSTRRLDILAAAVGERGSRASSTARASARQRGDMR
jgi:hypothetical protein